MLSVQLNIVIVRKLRYTKFINSTPRETSLTISTIYCQAKNALGKFKNEVKDLKKLPQEITKKLKLIHVFGTGFV